MTVFNITLYTDTICPWCYIGHKSLDKAIELYKRTYPGGSQAKFIFTYLPYYLDAAAPTPGIPWETRVAQKNGKDRVDAIRMRLQRVGRAHGIEFSFDTAVGNTRDSHRLLQYTQKYKGPETAKGLLEELFRVHFEQDGDITSHALLTRAAVVAGIPEEEASSLLASDEGGDEVDALAAKARAVDGVSSVPTVNINGKRAPVEGAGDPSEWFQVLIDLSGKTNGRLRRIHYS